MIRTATAKRKLDPEGYIWIQEFVLEEKGWSKRELMRIWRAVKNGEIPGCVKAHNKWWIPRDVADVITTDCFHGHLNAPLESTEIITANVRRSLNPTGYVWIRAFVLEEKGWGHRELMKIWNAIRKGEIPGCVKAHSKWWIPRDVADQITIEYLQNCRKKQ